MSQHPPFIETTKWLSRRIPAHPSRLRLFCFPHAGSGSAPYQSWRRELPDSIELCPIQLPGREVRLDEPCCTDSKLLITEIVSAVAGLLDIPYAIFGHSMGALLAYELAQSLRQRGLPQPLVLFVSGRRAPHLRLPESEIYALPHDQFLLELTRRYDGLPKELLENPEMLEVFLPILRADLTLIETHDQAEYAPLDCPIVAFAGSQDRNVSAEALRAWRLHTTSNFSSYFFPGGHFYITGANRKLLLQHLTAYLEDGSPSDSLRALHGSN